MSKNYMKDLATLFGVELGEKFKLLYPNGDEHDGEFTMTESGGFKRTDIGFYDCADILMCMLKGCFDIKKLPWKPQYGTLYYMPNISSYGLPQINSYEWCNNADDKSRYAAGMVCRTEDEARAKTEKMLASLKE